MQCGWWGAVGEFGAFGAEVSGVVTKPPAKKPARRPAVAKSSFVGEVSSGDRRRALVAMRDRLAADMDVASPMVVAQIAARLQAVLGEIDSLPDTGKVSLVDDLASKRRARVAEAEAVAAP